MVEYKSEIRQSVIFDLEKKVAKDNYSKYLKRLTLRKVRGFTDREVSFDFPVTALIGPNGGGKSTVLGAAALAYLSVPPGRFFAKSGKYDESMLNWSIEYELIDKKVAPRLSVSRTASFKQMKWNRKALDREVLVFGVERTLPATERAKLKPAIGGSFAAAREVTLEPEVTQRVAKILAKPIEGFQQLYVDEAGKVSLFSGRTPQGDGYSEFHFGSGEASVIRIVVEVEAASDGAMILIEEIENGLHPVATQRLVEYLIGVAHRKSCQVVFTTHSNDALAPLPTSAIWAALQGNVIQGKLDVMALRTITGQTQAKLAIFVEDEFAKLMVLTALRTHGDVELDEIKVHELLGADSAIKMNEQHNIDPTAPFPSVCILDGDQSDHADPTKGIFVLPGASSPEAHVLDRVMQRLDTVAGRLTLALHLGLHEQERVKRVVHERFVTNWDRHVIWEQIGADLDFTAGHTVKGAFLAIWAQEFPEEVRSLIDEIGDALPRREPEPQRDSCV
ncbi:ATP-dependent endonuclease [Streptomyces sp. NPDC001513]|uniref:ATP-dependent nuclease n=1 Tax=Streptomyces sp. NPDC001513 TaxID=3364580 RepID=UPI0036A21AA7